MKKITLGFAALAAFMFVGFETPTANAYGFGVHVGVPNVYLNVGSAHSRHYGSAHNLYRREYSNPRWYGSTSAYRGVNPHYRWHNTSRYAYYPGHYVPRGRNCDYNPRRPDYELHRDRNWDRHAGGHVDRHRDDFRGGRPEGRPGGRR